MGLEWLKKIGAEALWNSRDKPECAYCGGIGTKRQYQAHGMSPFGPFKEEIRYECTKCGVYFWKDRWSP